MVGWIGLPDREFGCRSGLVSFSLMPFTFPARSATVLKLCWTLPVNQSSSVDANGSRTRNVAPFPGPRLSHQIFPWCCSTIPLQMNRPNPVPVCLPCGVVVALLKG